MTPATQKIITVIAMVPKGKVASYGQIAKLAGSPGAARQVVWTLHSSSKKYKLPWHRIINAQGKIGLKDIYGNRQKLLLEKEGIAVDHYGKIDIETFGWNPLISRVKKVLKQKLSKESS
jgi:methylated-DNA-protein-cysteine methyltransferase-like protein